MPAMPGTKKKMICLSLHSSPLKSKPVFFAKPCVILCNVEQAKNMKLLLSAFEQLSGLKINFHKSEIFCFGEAKDYESQYEQLLGCKKVSYLFSYLGIPMHYRN
jgi:hypothetical protein